MIGKNIKERRLNLKKTQEWLAEQSNTTRQTIHRYETGEISNIPSDRIELIAKALMTTPAFLMGWEDDLVAKSTYGDHNKNLEYFSDKPEILETYKEIYENETLQLLFDSARDLEPEDLEAVIKHINLIKAARRNE